MKHSQTPPLYPYLLEDKPSILLNWILYKLFKRVSMDETVVNRLKTMRREGSIVYANKYRGLLDFVLYHYKFRTRRIPYPKVAFDLNLCPLLPFAKVWKVFISHMWYMLHHGAWPNAHQTEYYTQAIRKGTPAFISLIHPKRYNTKNIHSRKDHLQLLLEIQIDMDRPIFIVPQLILFKKTPEKEYKNIGTILFGQKDHMGVARKIILFFSHYRRAFIDFGKPLNLKDFLATQPSTRPLQDMAAEIRELLIERIDRQKRIIIGPLMKHRQQLKKLVLTDINVAEQIEKIAAGDEIKRKETLIKASEYFDEIAADYCITYIHLFRIALSWLWKTRFCGIDIDPDGPQKLRKWARNAPLIYIPSHKSHIDYLVLNNVLYNFHMHIPRIAAGQNLNFWPMGHIFRKSGAFFIRRTFRFQGAKLYREVFSRYIKALLQEGHPIEVYIEGGRSRDGKPVLPMTGFLSILLDALKTGYCNDLIFVPVSISYDRVLEYESYLKEIQGCPKEQENFFQMLRARRFLKNKYGSIYIRFHEPFSLRDYLSNTNEETRDITRTLANHLIMQINEVTPITPLSLIASAILTYHRQGFSEPMLLQTIDNLFEFIKLCHAPTTESLQNSTKAIQDTLALLLSWNIIHYQNENGDERDPTMYVENDKKMELEYYKNSILHYFIRHAFIAALMFDHHTQEIPYETIISEYIRLKRVFQNEFVFETEEDTHDTVFSILDSFHMAGYVKLVSGTENICILTDSGRVMLLLWAAFTKTFCESYWIAFSVIIRCMQEGIMPEDIIQEMRSTGKQLYQENRIEQIGAISQLTFRNALKYITKQLMIHVGESQEDKKEKDIQILTEIMSRLFRLMRIGR